MSSEAKFLTFGQIRTIEKDGKTLEFFEIDNSKLDELIGLLDTYFKNHVEGLAREQIWDAQKLKYGDPARLEKLQIRLFNKDDGPDFITHNLAMCKADCLKEK